VLRHGEELVTLKTEFLFRYGKTSDVHVFAPAYYRLLVNSSTIVCEEAHGYSVTGSAPVVSA
jgi:hypothetical protein